MDSKRDQNDEWLIHKDTIIVIFCYLFSEYDPRDVTVKKQPADTEVEHKY